MMNNSRHNQWLHQNQREAVVQITPKRLSHISCRPCLNHEQRGKQMFGRGCDDDDDDDADDVYVYMSVCVWMCVDMCGCVWTCVDMCGCVYVSLPPSLLQCTILSQPPLTTTRKKDNTTDHMLAHDNAQAMDDSLAPSELAA